MIFLFFPASELEAEKESESDSVYTPLDSSKLLIFFIHLGTQHVLPVMHTHV